MAGHQAAGRLGQAWQLHATSAGLAARRAGLAAVNLVHSALVDILSCSITVQRSQMRWADVTTAVCFWVAAEPGTAGRVGVVVHADKGQCPTHQFSTNICPNCHHSAAVGPQTCVRFRVGAQQHSAAPQRAQRRRWPQPAAARVARSFRGLLHPSLHSAFLSPRHWSGAAMSGSKGRTAPAGLLLAAVAALLALAAPVSAWRNRGERPCDRWPAGTLRRRPRR